MADMPLSHLSRPQLVHLLLRIVDLLSQPVVQVQPATPATSPCGPTLELYDASLDPWNAPDGGPVATDGSRNHGCLVARTPHLASILWCLVRLLAIPNDPAPGLPASPTADRSGTLYGQAGGCGGGVPRQNLPTENALPGCGPWVHVCGCLCRVCGAPCVLQRVGHATHLCALHKIP